MCLILLTIPWAYFYNIVIERIERGVMMYTCNPGIWEVGAEGQPGPHKALKQALKKVVLGLK